MSWAALFAVAVVGMAMAAGSLIDRVGETGTRVAHGLVALAVVLAPFALLWIVAEAHLRWSPRERVARGVVGWMLVAACLALLLVCTPPAIYLVIMNLAYACPC